MTVQQERFLAAYLETYNAAKSAVIAGYAPKYAHVTGYRLLKNREIRERIDDIMAQEKEKALMTRQERRAFWEAIMSDETAKTTDRLKASELLAKSYGDFDAATIERERLDSLTPEKRAEETCRNSKISFPLGAVS